MAVLLNFSLLQNPPTRSYAYDPLYRLTGVTDASAAVLEGYTYNATGDRLSKTYQGATDTYAYADPLTSHRLQAVDGVARSYDLNGNLLDRGGLPKFTFDERNRLSSVYWFYDYDPPGTSSRVQHKGAQSIAGGEDPKFASITQWIDYAYNGRGERVGKVETPFVISQQRGFAYDEGGRLMGEYGNDGFTPSAEYIYLDATPIAYVTGGQVYYVETDQLGTPRTVIAPGTTTATDKVVWKWDYLGSAFGEDYPDEDPDGDGENFTFNLRFPGQYFDAETGLSYNLNRDYESATGRYIESDPIGIDGGINTYGYAIESPLVYSDRWGLSSECTECDAQNSGANSGSGGGDDPGPEPGLEGVYPELFIIPLARAGSLAGAARRGGAALLNKCKNIRCKLPEIHDDHHTFGWPFNRKMCHLQLNCWIKGIKGSQFTIRIPFPCDGGGIPGFKDQR